MDHGLKAIKYESGKLLVLDQLKLPHEFVYDDVSTCEEAFDCIKSMRVRGAPAIAIVAALALAVELWHKKDGTSKKQDLVEFINRKLDYLMESRPTAVDLSNAIQLLKTQTQKAASDATASDETQACVSIREKFIEVAKKIFEDDLATNQRIGMWGAEYLRALQPPVTSTVTDDDFRYYTTSPPGTQGAPDQTYRKISVLTHCNTGSLATSGVGTALGIIRKLHDMNYLDHAYCTETRPYNQGSRLTAFELVYEKIPSTLITDSMAASLFKTYKDEKNITAVIVGADRVVRNGDTANKIGTYQLAVLAKAHGIKFVVAAPTTSVDLEKENGDLIKIENRAQTELTQISGAVVGKDGKVDVNHTERVAIADQRINVWNPAFDVTPYQLIDSIITEHGPVPRNAKGKFDFKAIMPERWKAQVDDVAGGSAAVKMNGSDGLQFQMDV
ncbi:probable Methylthioribose-1-phosphate isomerase [Phialocephala subalpina]|uniref:Methylthioribose-1-phosphate isomerase n=1 Tax=Phialocephala subalpina TaxID=576137 RepID=A0A1L7WD01_9HELO|nr:probable Methylthioribose-1-phosphate isomerase [Phialocephala subalpina]